MSADLVRLDVHLLVVELTMRYAVLSFALAVFSVVGRAGAEEPPAERWIHPACKALDITANGPFVQLDDGTLMRIDKNVLRTSKDGGKTWSQGGAVIDPGMDFSFVGHVGQFMRTRSGALVILFLDFTTQNFAWDNEKGAPKPECKLEMWAIRSIDGGQTWTDRQRLLDGYNADFMGFIQTTGGNLVATVEHLVPELRRWVCLSFVSQDDGKTWRRSNLIDLGGHGHHDGAVEPMVIELRDKRLMMLIRTSLDQFWKAYSDDQGQYWRVIQPSGIDASSAPGWLLRLRSGRLGLVWNRLNPEGKPPHPKHKSAGPATEYPVSWFRGELSIAFSDDDGTTWSKPIVIAREQDAQLSYPYMMERQPGELWIFTRYTYHRGGKPAPSVAVSLKEEDFVPKTAK
jgi:sialidase-1